MTHGFYKEDAPEDGFWGPYDGAVAASDAAKVMFPNDALRVVRWGARAKVAAQRGVEMSDN